MAKGQFFEFVVLHHPTPKKDQGGNDITEPSTVIVPHGSGVFKDEKEANLKVARMIPESYSEKLHECEVSIRPF